MGVVCRLRWVSRRRRFGCREATAGLHGTSASRLENVSSGQRTWELRSSAIFSRLNRAGLVAPDCIRATSVGLARLAIRDAVNARSRMRQLCRKPARRISERPQPQSLQSQSRSQRPSTCLPLAVRSPWRSWFMTQRSTLTSHPTALSPPRTCPSPPRLKPVPPRANPPPLPPWVYLPQLRRFLCRVRHPVDRFRSSPLLT
jgi:hypothetical protein